MSFGDLGTIVAMRFASALGVRQNRPTTIALRRSGRCELIETPALGRVAREPAGDEHARRDSDANKQDGETDDQFERHGRVLALDVDELLHDQPARDLQEDCDGDQHTNRVGDEQLDGVGNDHRKATAVAGGSATSTQPVMRACAETTRTCRLTLNRSRARGARLSSTSDRLPRLLAE